MKFSFLAFFVFFICQLSLFALNEAECLDIIQSEKSRYEKTIGDSFEVNEYKFEEKEGYIQVDFIINGTPLRVISSPQKESFVKELRELFALNAGSFVEKSDYYIYSKYKNVIAAKGDLSRGDVVFYTSPSLKRHSFIVDSFLYENDEKISLLKPLYNSKLFRNARLERKKNPIFLDVSYSLGFINYFRHVLSADVKFSFSYPVMLKVGFRNDLLTSFGFDFEEEIFGINAGLECIIPFDLLISRISNLTFFTEFNSLFGINTTSGKFVYTSDFGLGVFLYIKSNMALKSGVRMLNIGGLYTFAIPMIQLGCSVIL